MLDCNYDFTNGWIFKEGHLVGRNVPSLESRGFLSPGVKETFLCQQGGPSHRIAKLALSQASFLAALQSPLDV